MFLYSLQTKTLKLKILLKKINVLGISLEESTESNNTSAGYVESVKIDNVNKNVSIRSENEEYLSLNDGLEYAYPSGNQSVPDENTLVKDTDLSVEELQAKMASL